MVKKIIDPSFGKLYKEFRTEKGYLLKEVASDAVSLPTISKFESGDSDLTLQKFLTLLNYSNISVEEYFARLNEDYSCPERLDVTRWVAIGDSRNSEKILDYIQEIQKKVEQFPEYVSLKLTEISLKSLSSNFTGKVFEITEIELRKVTNHLQSIKRWSEFEYRLFGRILWRLSFDAIEVLYPIFSIQSRLNQYYDSLSSICWINLVDRLLKEFSDGEQKEESLETLKEIRKLTENLSFGNDQLANALYLKFNFGCLDVLLGRTEEGLEVINLVIETYKLIGLWNFAQEFAEDRDQVLEKAKN